MTKKLAFETGLDFPSGQSEKGIAISYTIHTDLR